VQIVLFNVTPQLLDVAVATLYLLTSMQPWAALTVGVTVAVYVPLTILITERRGAVRKRCDATAEASLQPPRVATSRLKSRLNSHLNSCYLKPPQQPACLRLRLTLPHAELSGQALPDALTLPCLLRLHRSLRHLIPGVPPPHA
jgi:hypothetical protein